MDAQSDAKQSDVKKEERPLGSRAPQFIKARRPLHMSWQVGVFLVGLLIVVTGVILLPLPGPGWLIIFGGMAVWATEFVWAQIVMRWTKGKLADGTGYLKRRRAERAARKGMSTP
ncbi:TIGR02611 family protein [Streptomyces sp. N2-109]|uniref:TIGR02611 family protein n=1 Tax=Streptomyces gossypii TaxID=2883101 RepID=A0ABT2JLK8_9ACTN|nr:TIGR02611 family protein [Streptomyces gossypii]MCT2588603.1 TIGR02611 family protein [Streptomyces gossypii]